MPLKLPDQPVSKTITAVWPAAEYRCSSKWESAWPVPTPRVSQDPHARPPPRSAQAERKQKDDAVRTTIMQKLVETGEKERLKELLRQKLVECGWRDELKEYCKGA